MKQKIKSIPFVKVPLLFKNITTTTTTTIMMNATLPPAAPPIKAELPGPLPPPYTNRTTL